ncbi:MAG TPA: AAA family ATPase [Micropruina sp.]|jgi:predicted kinase|nr:AAA family ATPase [Micropruina sp.]
MATLILLNGPPRVGKSTLAARYADLHPGTLCLDIDSLHYLIGGWRDIGAQVHDLLRPLALAMTHTHLAGGNDVIVPQYVADPDAVAAFELLAHRTGATFCEVVLMSTRDEAIERFADRPDDTEWAAHNRRLVADLGGPEFLGAMHDRLADHLGRRPRSIVIESRRDAIDDTFADLLRAVGDQPSPS